MEIKTNGIDTHTYIFDKNDIEKYEMKPLIKLVTFSSQNANFFIPKFIEILKLVDEEYGTNFDFGGLSSNQLINIGFSIFGFEKLEIEVRIVNKEECDKTPSPFLPIENAEEKELYQKENSQSFASFIENILKQKLYENEKEDTLFSKYNIDNLLFLNEKPYICLKYCNIKNLLDFLSYLKKYEYFEDFLLYSYKDEYYLYFNQTTNLLKYALIEYNDKSFSKISFELLQEHGKLLSTNPMNDYTFL